MAPATHLEGDVTFAIAPDPALVRTARLVSAAVARRYDHDGTVVEAVRLAVGEACAVMIGPDRVAGRQPAAGGGDPLAITLHQGRAFVVTVRGQVADPGPNSVYGEIGLDPWVLLRGIAPDLDIAESGGVTEVTMTWPL